MAQAQTEANTPGKLTGRLRGWFKLRRQRILCLEDPGQIVPVVAKVKVEISEITADNAHRVTDFRPDAHVANFLRNLRQGQVGVFAWLGAKVVGHAWAHVCRGLPYRANGYMDIQPGEAFIHYCNVSPAHRGQWIYPSMLAALSERLFAAQHVHRVLIDSEAANTASLRGIAKAGFRCVGDGTYLQILGRLVFKRFAGATSAAAGTNGKGPDDDGQAQL